MISQRLITAVGGKDLVVACGVGPLPVLLLWGEMFEVGTALVQLERLVGTLLKSLLLQMIMLSMR